MLPPFGAQHWQRGLAARPFVLGHRGVRRSDVDENTLTAFERARCEGAAGVELDVRLDGSGNLVVIHDATLQRVSGSGDTRRIDRMSSGELSRIRLRHGERIPTFADALAWSAEHQQRLNIELKHDVPDRQLLLSRVAAAVARVPDAPERVVLSSFDPRLVLGLRWRLPEVARAWLLHDQQRWLKRGTGSGWLGAVGLHPQFTLLTPEAFTRYRRRALFLGTWTVNAPARVRALTRLGIDTLISDTPGAVLATLAAMD